MDKTSLSEKLDARTADCFSAAAVLYAKIQKRILQRFIQQRITAEHKYLL